MPGGFRTIIPMDAFDGGLNNKFEPQIIADNEAQSCLNVVFDSIGGVETRQGYSVVNTALVTSNPCDGLYTAKWNNGNESMVAFFGTDMFVLSGTSFVTVGSAQGNYATGTQKNSTMYQNVMFIGDGNTPAYKYDEGVYTRHGVEVPSLVADGNVHTAGGNLIGQYNYKLVYVNTQAVAGDLSTGCATITASGTGESLLLTGIAVGPQSFGVNTKWLYRTTAESGISGEYFFVASMAASITTYTDNIASASFGPTANTDAGKPPAYEFIIHHQERVFCNDSQNPQYLWYSDLAEPFTFQSTNFIKVADGDGEKITGLGVQGNSLIVFKESSVWIIYMPSTTDTGWIRIKSDAKYGCSSHRSILAYEKQLMYLGQTNYKVSGFYAFMGDTTQPDQTALRATQMFGDAKSDRIEPDVLLFQDSYKQNCSAIAFDNKLWFSITYGTGITANNRIYQFDYARRGKARSNGSWVPFTGIAANAFTVYASKLYFATSAATGFLYQLLDGTFTDNGAAIDSVFETKEFDGGPALRNWEKDFRRAEFSVETLGNWLMRISYRINSDKGAGDGQDIDLNPGGSLWGTALWTIDTWGGGQVRADMKIDLTGVGQRISVKFTNKNTAGSGFKVIRGNVYYNRRGLR